MSSGTRRRLTGSRSSRRTGTVHTLLSPYELNHSRLITTQRIGPSRECLVLEKLQASIAWLINSWVTRTRKACWSSMLLTKGLGFRMLRNCYRYSSPGAEESTWFETRSKRSLRKKSLFHLVGTRSLSSTKRIGRYHTVFGIGLHLMASQYDCRRATSSSTNDGDLLQYDSVLFGV